MNETIEELIINKLNEAGYKSETANMLVSYLNDAVDNQLDDSDYSQFLKTIIGDDKG